MTTVDNKTQSELSVENTKPQLITFKNEQQVEEYSKENAHLKLVIFEGSVYDVENYLPLHPGGSDMIEPYLGKSIDEPFEENEHTKTARNQFNSLPKIGFITSSKGDTNSNESTSEDERNAKQLQSSQQPDGLDGYKLSSKLSIDYNKGLLNQLLTLNYTKEEYVLYILEPKHMINPVRDIILFDTPFLEFFSKTKWYAIPIFWGPIILYHLFQTEVGVFLTSMCIIAGLLFWSLSEYLLHRFFFHGEEIWLPADNKYVYVFHFLVHGIHHAFPQDRYRLVFPILPGYLLLTGVYLPILNTITPLWMGPGVKTGVALGYVLYDMIHYFIHHSSPKKGYFKFVKMYHMMHHYKNGELGYGVSSKLWDIIFRTELELKMKQSDLM